MSKIYDSAEIHGSKIEKDTFAGFCIKFNQPLRSICGRGYDRQAFSSVTYSPHSVIIGFA
jgi:hypothetical protein